MSRLWATIFPNVPHSLGPKMFDKRLTPARPDLAAEHLRGKVDAPRFAIGELREIRDGITALRREPRPDAPQDSELLFGETFTVYETDEEGWCWGQSMRDSYVGYVSANALTLPTPKTHRLTALRSFIYPGLSIKLPPIEVISLNSLLTVTRTEGDFLVLGNGGAIWASHAVPLVSAETDFVAVAEHFVGVPYLWGGRSSLGLDCSGLVQLAQQACGHDVLRDSDMQEQSLGAPVNGPFQRGDLVFWKGHVGIMQNGSQLLHANGFTMSVYSEPLAEARARILAKGGGEVTSLKRL